MQLAALLRLGFPSAPYLKYLTLLHIVTRWLVLQKARHHTLMVLWPVVGTRFQILFHSPPGVLFTFPSRYFFSIGHQVVFSLGRWSSLLPTGFLVSGGTLVISSDNFEFSPTGFSPSVTLFPNRFGCLYIILCWIYRNPEEHALRFGLFPFRSPLLRKSIFLSLPPGT